MPLHPCSFGLERMDKRLARKQSRPSERSDTVTEYAISGLARDISIETPMIRRVKSWNFEPHASLNTTKEKEQRGLPTAIFGFVYRA